MPRYGKEALDEEEHPNDSFDKAFQKFVIQEMLNDKSVSELIRVGENEWFKLSKPQKKQLLERVTDPMKKKKQADAKRLQHEALDNLNSLTGIEGPIIDFSQESCGKKPRKRMCCPRKRKRKSCRKPRKRMCCPRKRKPRCPRRRKKRSCS